MSAAKEYAKLVKNNIIQPRTQLTPNGDWGNHVVVEISPEGFCVIKADSCVLPERKAVALGKYLIEVFGEKGKDF